MDTKTASPKDEDSYGDMKIVQEMYASGFDFMPIDIFKVKAHEFQIIGDRLMPALDTIDGLGEKAADLIVEAVKDLGLLRGEQALGLPGEHAIAETHQEQGIHVFRQGMAQRAHMEHVPGWRQRCQRQS